MNVIAILNHMGVYFKEEPIRELHRALERLNFQIVYPNDRDDLLKLIENNARLCGVIFDWDKYNLELCEEISKMNENLPLYAFANTYSTLDVSLNDLRLQISFFEYALGAAEDIANKIKQTTDEYINTILPPLTKALFKYVREGKYTFCTPGHMGGTAFQKSPVGSLFYDFKNSKLDNLSRDVELKFTTMTMDELLTYANIAEIDATVKTAIAPITLESFFKSLTYSKTAGIVVDLEKAYGYAA